MPATKRKSARVIENDANVKKIAILSTQDALPFVQYTSALAVHTTLLSFIALFLPRTAFLYDLTRPAWDPTKQSSLDKPQHPFLDALTLSPLSTVAWICVGVAMLQVWWGGWVRGWYIGIVIQNQDDSEGENGEENKRIRRVKMQEQRFKHLKAASLATAAASLVLHAILILLGAPLTNCSTPFLSGPDCPSDSLHLRTYLLALLLALLTVPTPAYTLGIPNILKNDSQAIVLKFLWTRLFAEFSIRNSLERALAYPVIGTMIGSWIGAIPIALDWDRPWQAWPLTPVYGAITGYVVGSLTALTVTAVSLMAKEHLLVQALAAEGKTQTKKIKSKSS